MTEGACPGEVRFEALIVHEVCLDGVRLDRTEFNYNALSDIDTGECPDLCDCSGATDGSDCPPLAGDSFSHAPFFILEGSEYFEVRTGDYELRLQVTNPADGSGWRYRIPMTVD